MFKRQEKIEYSEEEKKRLKEVLLHMYLSRMFTSEYMYHPNALTTIKAIGLMLGLHENEVLNFVYSHKRMEFTPTRFEKVNALTYIDYPVTKIMKNLNASHTYVKSAYVDDAIGSPQFPNTWEMVERFLSWFEMVFDKRDLE